MPIQVLLVDDQNLFRRLLSLRLDEEPDLVVQGEVGDGLAALELASRCRPDVVVTELRLGGCSGVEMGQRIRSRQPHTQIIVLTALSELADLGYLASAFTCLPKSCTPEELCAEIRRAHQGGSAARCDPGGAHRLTLERLAEARGLTERERQVLIVSVLTDLTHHQMARKLAREFGSAFTPSAVKHALDRVFIKLAVYPRTRPALIKRALGGALNMARREVRTEEVDG